ncbi:MAG: magnesium/cobalt transporter CorA [Paludibacteraceae bacterium]|nr:magnesium/cobalt transporter CorA [Paludibacteraceae bacterium]
MAEMKTNRNGELKIFYKDNEKIKVARTLTALKELDKKDIIWIDLIDVSDKTEDTLEGFLKIDIQEDEEMEEIEMSSRYIQTDDSIIANSNFLTENFDIEPVNFIIKNNILVTTRDVDLNSFNETVKRLFVNARNFPSGYHVLVALMETRVEKDADMIEDTTDLITKLSSDINASDHVDEEVLIQIKDLQEKVTIIRQNIMDKQRVISNFLKCDFFPEELQPRLTMIIKDINSLFDYTRFGFDRLDYLQDTFLGLVNIEQNKIIKIFTVVNVIFLPPTLVASMYGMNFDIMPELHWRFGYLFAIGLMIVFTLIVLLIFKLKKWL